MTLEHCAAVLSALALVGCSSPSGSDGGGGGPTGARGVIAGRVVDAQSGRPIASVTIKAYADTVVTGTTDAEGVFALKDLPLGTMTVAFELAGYVRSLCTPTLDVTTATQGNVLARCDMVMAKAEARLEGFVVTPDGKPVQGMSLTADLRTLSGPMLFSGYDLVATTTTATDGSFAFASLPAVPRGVGVTVSFQPFDVNGDGEPEWPAFNRSFTVFPGASAPMVVVLSAQTPQIVVTNLSDNELAPGEAATVTWNIPLETANATVRLVDASRNTEVPVEATWSSGLTLTARPANSGALIVGQRYYLSVNAKAVGTDSSFGNTWTLYFTVRPSTVNPITAQVTNLAVALPVAPAHSSNAFTVSFTGVAGAAGYKVYAKDTLLNQAWILASAFSGSNAGTVYRAFTLPSQFDAYFFDGSVWPLAGGNRITFAVVPFDAVGNESPLSAAPTVQVQDVVAPTWTALVAQQGDAVNDTGSPTRVTVGVNFSEPMKGSVPPQLVTASGLAATWAWAVDYQSGLFTLTIPPNTNAAEGFVIRGGEDQNGNKISNGELSNRLVGVQDFLTNTGFEDGPCSLAAWTPTNSGSPALGVPVAQANTYAMTLDPRSRCAAAVGSINGSAAGVGLSRLSQQFTVPATLPPGRSLVARAAVRFASDTSPVSAGGLVRCAVMDQTFTTVVANVVVTTGNAVSSGFATYSTTPALVAGTSYQALCEATLSGTNPAEFGMWVDDFQVGVAFN